MNLVVRLVDQADEVVDPEFGGNTIIITIVILTQRPARGGSDTSTLHPTWSDICSLIDCPKRHKLTYPLAQAKSAAKKVAGNNDHYLANLQLGLAIVNVGHEPSESTLRH